VTAPQHAPQVAAYLGADRLRLSPASLETLSVVAYRQPVTRAEVEAIRGVNCDQTFYTLASRRLIEERGRKETPGRPILYGTTWEFLECFGLQSLDDLPRALADRGVASRRAAEELMREGRVRVEGEVIREMGTRVVPDARIEVDGHAVAPPAPHRYVLLNKPRGIVSTARDERGRPTVVEMLGARERLYPVGRLDEDSEGLVLLTNDGAWAERVLHPRYGHEREYEVSVAGPVSPDSVAALRRGIALEEGIARAVRVSVAGGPRGLTVRMVLNTGWKRQVRRMCAAVGIRVLRLRRVRLGSLALGRLRTGAWRELTTREVRALGGS